MNMTPEEMTTFCKAAASGVAMGLNHRYEWYVNAQRMLSHGVYSEIAENEIKIDRAFIAFEKETADCPETEELLRTMDLRGYKELVSEYYKENGSHETR